MFIAIVTDEAVFTFLDAHTIAFNHKSFNGTIIISVYEYIAMMMAEADGIISADVLVFFDLSSKRQQEIKEEGMRIALEELINLN